MGSCLLIIASFVIQPPGETTPRQSGNFEQPQNLSPECGLSFNNLSWKHPLNLKNTAIPSSGHRP